jgi:hypothetical protein
MAVVAVLRMVVTSAATTVVQNGGYLNAWTMTRELRLNHEVS